jgi:acetyl-CoA carboxylase biotin carboxyl carrier protein
MSGSTPAQDIFDVRKIRRLVELMNEHDLSEMDLRQGEMRIQLRRGGAPVIHQSVPSSAPAQPASAGAAPAPKAESASATAQSTPQEEHIALITSPMVGTFYSSPDPDASPYIKVGDHVHKETTVCIVEAMKVFNEIQAEVAGKIVAVLVESGEPVEFGQPMFKVDTRH